MVIKIADTKKKLSKSCYGYIWCCLWGHNGNKAGNPGYSRWLEENIRTTRRCDSITKPLSQLNVPVRFKFNGARGGKSKLRHLRVSSKSQKLVAANQNDSHHKVPTQQQKELLLLTPPTIFSISCFLSPQSPPCGWIFSLITARHLLSIINVFIFLLFHHFPHSSADPPPLCSLSPHLAEQQRPSAGRLAWRFIPTANLISCNQWANIRKHFGPKLLTGESHSQKTSHGVKPQCNGKK